MDTPPPRSWRGSLPGVEPSALGTLQAHYALP